MRFNKGQFNKSSFNKSAQNSYIYSISKTLGVSSQGNSNVICNVYENISHDIKIQSSGNSNVLVNMFCSGVENIKINANAKENVLINMYDSIGKNIKVFSNASSQVTREEEIYLPDLVLRAGQELIINTCDLTIAVDGQNVINYLDNSSVFFELVPNDNTIIYEDSSGSRNVEIDIIFKDKYV